MCALSGEPHLPWAQRFNLTVKPLCSGADWVSLATAAALWIRVRPMPLPCHLFLAAISLACVVNAAWRRVSARAPGGGLWVRWRELPASLFRLFGFGAGTGLVLVVRFLDDLPPAEDYGWGSLARHTAAVVLASLVPSLLLLWVARPVRISLALPVQLALTLHCARSNPALCSTRALGLSHPTGQHLTQRAYQLVSMARYITSPPGSRSAPLPPEAQCSVLLTFAQLAVAIALPSLAQAAAESRLFELHQAQRRAAGLAPEAGPEACLYGLLYSLQQAIDGPLLVLFSWVLLGLLFDLAGLLALGWTDGGGGAVEELPVQ